MGKGGNDVFDGDEIASLFAISVDGDGFVGQGFANEDGHRGGVGAAWILTWAEDIEKAQ